MSNHHAAASSEWYTPPAIVDAARVVLGSIRLDPASCVEANRSIGADIIYTEADDGLSKSWQGPLFLNPPSPPRAWWDRLIEEHTARRVPEAIYVAYSIESLQQSQGWAAPMLAFPVCLPAKRLRFLTRNADMIAKRAAAGKAPGKLLDLPPDALVPGDAPTHASAIVGVGVNTAAFVSAFSAIGAVVVPAQPAKLRRVAA